MDCDVMPLWREKKTCAGCDDPFQPYLEIHTLDTEEPRGAVIVCPGGGYARRADHEAAVIAKRFNQLGFHAFVLHYRVAPYRHPEPLHDAARAIRMVRAGAEKWQVKPDKIAILGFSAGGHLTGSIGVHYPDVPADPDFPGVSCRPDNLILCYAVLNNHVGSFVNLLSPDLSQPRIEYCRLNKFVTKETPPAFIWHTFEDASVPVANALDFAAALDHHKVPFELHVFPRGHHGIGLGEQFPEAAIWPELCGTWLRNLGW